MARISSTAWAGNQVAAWIGDFLDPDTALVRAPARLDPTQFFATDSVLVTVDTGGAAIGATSIPVTALPGALPNGTLLDFTGTGKFALLTAAAAAAATSITVQALPQAVVAGDTARYVGAGTKNKTVVSGTLVGRTRTERDANTGYGPWASGDHEVFLIAFDVSDVDTNPDCVLYRHNRVVKENYLPAQSQATNEIAQVRTLYTSIVGTA